MTREWTDLDYAQAAIDMLPGSVEEGIKFLRAQKIQNKRSVSRTGRSSTCPISQWVRKWTDTNNVYTGWSNTYVRNEALKLPKHVQELILELDRIQT